MRASRAPTPPRFGRMPLRHPRGAASVEQAGLVLGIALLLVAAVSAIAASGPDDAGPELGSALARKLRCAPRLPGPCWRDSLTEAYGRPLAGLVRALAPVPAAVPGPTGEALAPVDFRYCRQPSCAVPSGRVGLDRLQPPRHRLHLGRGPSRGPGHRRSYVLAVPADARLGSCCPHGRLRTGRRNGIHAAAREREPAPRAARDARRSKPLRLPGPRGATLALAGRGRLPRVIRARRGSQREPAQCARALL